MNDNLNSLKNENRLSFSGILLGFFNLLMITSIIPSFRIHFLDYKVHLTVLFCVPLVLVFTLKRLRFFSKKFFLIVLLLFSTIFLSEWMNGHDFKVIVKFGSIFLYFLVGASCCLSEKDYYFSVVMNGVFISLMTFHGLYSQQMFSDVAASGVTLLRGIGNKNAYSLYALPGVVLAINLYLKDKKKVNSFFLLPGILFGSFGLIISGSRAAWLCLLVVFAFALKREVNLKFIFKTILLGGTIIFIVFRLSFIERIFQNRINQTLDNYNGDNVRVSLIEDSLNYWTENPILGVSYFQLQKYLGLRYTHFENANVHNFFAMFLSSYGILGAVVFSFFLYFLFKYSDKNWKNSGNILSFLLLIWLLKGVSTEEVLFSPTFFLALGLGVSYVRLEQKKFKPL